MRAHLIASFLLALGLSLGGCGGSTHARPADAGVEAAVATDAPPTGDATSAADVGVDAPPAKPVIDLTTTLGVIAIELEPDVAPVSVANFLSYVDRQFYDGTIFHRVIPGFMIQGGGLLPDMTEKPANAPIVNEGGNGLHNTRGTIAYARTSDPDSATCQFFINLVDNGFLDQKTGDGGVVAGYAVFGHVTVGLDVLDAIGAVATTTVGGYQDVPVTPVVINTARRE